MLCLLGTDWGAAEKVFLFVKEFAESHSGRRHERCFEDECVCLLHFVGITTGDASLPALLLPVKL